MARSQSSFITHEGEVNGQGNITRLKAFNINYYAPLSQDNVSLERDFSNAALVAQGFNPVVNDPQNLNVVTQQIQGFNAAANLVLVSNDKKTGRYKYSVRVDEKDITDGSSIQQSSSRNDKKIDKNAAATVSLKDSQDFVKIIDGKNAYYGGDQAWYGWPNDDEKTNIAINGGCGTVASANLVAYLASHYEKYKKLYSYSDFSKENYKKHMEDMFEYVTPKHINGLSLGVWPISVVVDGVEKFASDRGVELKAKLSHKIFNLENITKYIKEGLENDSPVAMLIGTNVLNNVTITNFDGSSWTQDMSLHWVTITELKIKNKTTKVKVSTWGGWAELDLAEYLEEWIYEGIIYFT